MSNVAPLDPSFYLQGPLDVAQFPTTLNAAVVTPGPAPRLRGYDVESDLARHYNPLDMAVLSLTGELPTPENSAALAIAVSFLAPLSIAHASVHAAALARVCGTTTGSTLGVAAIGLAEQARLMLDEHVDLLAWLAAPAGPLPERYRATQAADRASTGRLRDALATTGVSIPGLDQSPTRTAALLMVLVTCGMKERSQLEALIVTARLPSAFAEAMSVKVADFDHYPTNMPRYRYSDAP